MAAAIRERKTCYEVWGWDDCDEREVLLAICWDRAVADALVRSLEIQKLADELAARLNGLRARKEGDFERLAAAAAAAAGCVFTADHGLSFCRAPRADNSNLCPEHRDLAQRGWRG